ncbi:hypothetical protein [Acidithiobacillus thiooxidans]|nr:hypothetical protein [Acidithiobacillus thiooxidans]
MKTGTALLIRSDRKVLRRNIVSGKWQEYRKIKEGVSVEAYIAHRMNDHSGGYWVTLKRGMIPCFDVISAMERNGVAEATDGCENIEPDGKCLHGYPAWPLVAIHHCLAG